MNLVFFEMFFYLQKLTTCFSSENRQQSDAHLGRKKHMFFLVMCCLNLMRALILNREKKHSGLSMTRDVVKPFSQLEHCYQG